MIVLGLLPSAGAPAWACWGERFCTAAERAQAARLAPAQRVAFAARRALARALAAPLLGLEAPALRFGTAPSGQPRLLAAGHPDAVVSFSGTAGLSAVAVGARGAIGIDVEHEMAPVDLLGAARLVMPEAEVALLRTLGEAARARRFLAGWTRREAVLKLLGLGLAHEPRRLVIVDDTGDRGVWQLPCPDAAGWWQDLDTPRGWVGAVAGIGTMPATLPVRWSAAPAAATGPPHGEQPHLCVPAG